MEVVLKGGIDRGIIVHYGPLFHQASAETIQLLAPLLPELQVFLRHIKVPHLSNLRNAFNKNMKIVRSITMKSKGFILLERSS